MLRELSLPARDAELLSQVRHDQTINDGREQLTYPLLYLSASAEHSLCAIIKHPARAKVCEVVQISVQDRI